MRLARRAMAHGCALGPDDLVITTGALDAVTLALRATCKGGDTVAIESPMYYGLLQSIEALGLRVVEIASHPRDGLSLVALREALSCANTSGDRFLRALVMYRRSSFGPPKAQADGWVTMGAGGRVVRAADGARR